jgi:nicotinamidase-related amidase
MQRRAETPSLRSEFCPSHRVVLKCVNRSMQHPNTLALSQSALLIIDVQEAFRGSIPDYEKLVGRIAVAIRGAKILNLPILLTEQYPKGLGHTASEIAAVLPEGLEIVEKTSFSSCGAQAFLQQLKRHDVKQLLVSGIEAHICVNQTVHDLLASNYQVHLLADCISSRKQLDKEIAFRKMEQSGALFSSVELALFELLRDAKHEQFKAIQGLIK